MKTFAATHFLSRELSWLEFNQRVLNEALTPANPLLERMKFFTITSSNLDEFFEVRVAGIKQQIESDVVERSIDGRTSTEIFKAITKRVRQMIDQQYRCWREDLVPNLAKHHINFLDYEHGLSSTTARKFGRCSRRWASILRILFRNC
jgi:polyphosphate kinase